MADAARLGIGTKLAYGIGTLAEGIKTNAFDVFVFFYFTQVLGLDQILAGLAIACALLADAISDPLAGSLSDNQKGRWGRRHGFMYAAAVPLGLSFMALMAPPEGLSQTGLFLWLSLGAIAVRVSMTFYAIPHTALGAELTAHYDERTVVVAWRTLFGLLGALLTSGLGITLFFPETGGPDSGLKNPDGYGAFGIFFGALMTMAVLASALGTHHKIPDLLAPAVSDLGGGYRRVVRELREALSNRSFRALFFGMILYFIVRGVMTTLGVHMGLHFWALDSNEIRNMMIGFALGFAVGATIAMPLGRRIDKKGAWLWGMAWLIIWGAAAASLRLLGLFPDNSDPLLPGLVVGATFIASIGGGVALATASSMMADVADDHEATHGTRREGIFFGALMFSLKASQGIGWLVGALVLEAIAFPENAIVGSVPQATLNGLGVAHGPGAALLGLAGLIFVWRGYAITRNHMVTVRRVIAVKE